MQLDKHQSEKTRAFADMAMKAADLSHNHALDVEKFMHEKEKLSNNAMLNHSQYEDIVK